MVHPWGFLNSRWDPSGAPLGFLNSQWYPSGAFLGFCEFAVGGDPSGTPVVHPWGFVNSLGVAVVPQHSWGFGAPQLCILGVLEIRSGTPAVHLGVL